MSVPGPVSFERALEWIDATAKRLGSEEISLETGLDRVLAADLHASAPIPPADCTAADGFAVHAADSLGAGAYNPLALPAVAVTAGECLPAETDAVVMRDQAEPDGTDRILVVEPIVAGANVDRRGAVATAGDTLVTGGVRLAARHLAILALGGVSRVAVTRCPRVRLVIASRSRSGQPIDSNGVMLRALIERDGGLASDADLAHAFAPGVDIVIVAGGTGHGDDDRSAAALAAAGSVDFDGVALSPGETAGFGHTAAGVPAILLPGSPAACLWNYELFAGRAIRRLGGRDRELPYRCAKVTTSRKVVSAIGTTEICPIRRRADGGIEPVAAFAEIGLAAAIAADGFLIVPAASEGYPAGAVVNAYFYGDVERAEPIR